MLSIPRPEYEGNPTCPLCGAVMVPADADTWKCLSCGSTLDDEDRRPNQPKPQPAKQALPLGGLLGVVQKRAEQCRQAGIQEMQISPTILLHLLNRLAGHECDQWIPVAKNPPDSGTYILAAREGTSLSHPARVLRDENGTITFWWGAAPLYDITHWRPMPMFEVPR